MLLDQPYPENLPVVPACRDCNESFSLDEEYLACLIDCVLAGSASAAAVKREKIQRLLTEKPALAQRVANVREILEGQTYFRIEGERVRNVVLKLARGHAHYELSDPKLEEPTTVDFAPLVNFSARDREGFEYVNPPHLFPEVGSRALQRVVASGMTEWIVVQPDRYRYLAIPGDKVEVRMVLSEYLACRVVWANA